MQPAYDFSDRHSATQEKLFWLQPNPNLPAGTPTFVSQQFFGLAQHLVTVLKDGPQLTIALQKLIEAKDAAVRQAIVDARE